jgi:hypothetical protein
MALQMARISCYGGELSTPYENQVTWRWRMVVLTATCKNGIIQLDRPLPPDWEGKQIQVTIEEVTLLRGNRRQSGSAKGQIRIAPDFDAPLDDFQDYMV